MLFFLLAGHALMDFALQTDAIAACKCRRANHPLQRSVPWFYWLGAHAMMHGLAVGVIVRWFGHDWTVATGLAIAETVVHAFIDMAKCEKLFNIHVDQALHALCKLLWWGLLATSVIPL